MENIGALGQGSKMVASAVFVRLQLCCNKVYVWIAATCTWESLPHCLLCDKLYCLLFYPCKTSIAKSLAYDFLLHLASCICRWHKPFQIKWSKHTTQNLSFAFISGKVVFCWSWFLHLPFVICFISINRQMQKTSQQGSLFRSSQLSMIVSYERLLINW